MKRIFFRVFAAAIVSLVIGSLYSFGQTPAKAPAKHPLDKGDFKVGFSPKTRAKTPNKKMPADEVEVFQEVADALNDGIALPKDVYINMDTCGEPNAYYDPNTSEISFCYELLDEFETQFKTVTKDQAKVDAMVEDTLIQTLFHELGHCLIHVWDLPATGREEDAVDQLATVLLLDGSPEGRTSAINAALQFSIAAKSDNPKTMLFWDEHSFNKTRFFDMMCLVYGSDPNKGRSMVGPDKLPQQRAERCGEEWYRIERAWLKLLAPYVIGV